VCIAPSSIHRHGHGTARLRICCFIIRTLLPAGPVNLVKELCPPQLQPAPHLHRGVVFPDDLSDASVRGDEPLPHLQPCAASASRRAYLRLAVCGGKDGKSARVSFKENTL
jgi:hypothetical protein